MMKPTQMEIDEREKVFQNKIAYSEPIVHVGFWNDELAIQEDNMRVAAYKRDRCELLIQKTRKMLRNLLKATVLALENPYVLYGENYQIKAYDIKNNHSKEMFLAGLINEKEIDCVQHFQHGCGLSATPMEDACVRNTFRIKGPHSNKDGQQVLFGEDVLLEISESCGPPLYVQCENSTVATFGEHLILKLSQDPDIYCRFKFFHGNPGLRNKTLGATFTPNSRIIIQHTASGQNLALEPTRLIPTFYGPEMQVSCHTYRDCHKMDGPENFWKIATRRVADAALLVRAAKGENIPPELIEAPNLWDC